MGKKQAKRSVTMPHPTSTACDIQLDQRGDGLYSGTFRWTDRKAFPPLPPRHPGATIPTDPLERGWQGYLSQCHGTHNIVPMAAQDPSFLDALSFPMTFVYAAKALHLMDTGGGQDRHVVVIGATVKAEQRIFDLTKYWNEITAFFPELRMTLWFVGPEVVPHRGFHASSSTTTFLEVRFVQATAGSFLATHSSTLTPHNAVMVGYNTGFGNFIESNRFDLLWSWLPDLMAIADSNIPTVFTCANDYADLNGEFAIQSRLVGANFVLLPKENPFSAASHLHEENKKDTAWSRANSFLYVVQGGDLARRHHLNHGDLAGLNSRLDEPLDLHFQDRLGRHFFKGMVLSKDQAARSKLLQQLHGANSRTLPCPGSTGTPPSVDLATVTSAIKECVVGDADDNQGSHDIATPEYTIVSNAAKTDMRITISTPSMETSQNMQLDVSGRALRFVVPGMYFLELDLPWDVASSGDAMQAVYVKKTRTLCIELHSTQYFV
ncbi:hypothetical protein H310_00874 [Aphanomyces invadans]|uniref:Uncharacterized protein n=1 Tax=Aphanomyces invadans TaxID=157072 RepID=A0A024UPK8_9STRA|nr:hypothetical protein H310_00874 [Aphanomyces invadans]ETW08234.1 hypothetical protein H310_00874 [Aphanomyces invadans]|eukprot:XP_008862039.1 hypothetical protein H310_00874 [Aphanomyces invadans]